MGDIGHYRFGAHGLEVSFVYDCEVIRNADILTTNQARKRRSQWRKTARCKLRHTSITHSQGICQQSSSSVPAPLSRNSDTRQDLNEQQSSKYFSRQSTLQTHANKYHPAPKRPTMDPLQMDLFQDSRKMLSKLDR